MDGQMLDGGGFQMVEAEVDDSGGVNDREMDDGGGDGDGVDMHHVGLNHVRDCGGCL